MDWPLEVDWSCDCTRNMPIDSRDASLYYTIYGMPSTRLARAYENVFWLDDRGDKGPCRRVHGGKLMSRASSMEWRGTAPSMQKPSFLGDYQCSVRST